jgi:hypothetical protein
VLRSAKRVHHPSDSPTPHPNIEQYSLAQSCVFTLLKIDSPIVYEKLGPVGLQALSNLQRMQRPFTHPAAHNAKVYCYQLDYKLAPSKTLIWPNAQRIGTVSRPWTSLMGKTQFQKLDDRRTITFKGITGFGRYRLC